MPIQRGDYAPLAEVRGIPAPERPSAWDAFWLALFVANAGLLLWLLPDKLLKSDALDLLSGKIAPWLATTMFVAGYTWWRDEVLRVSRLTWFRAIQIPAILILGLLEVPFVVVRAELTPPDAELVVDGEPAGRTMTYWRGSSYEHEMRFLLRPHHLELKRPAYWPAAIDVGSQTIELGWGDIVNATMSHRSFHWSLVWTVNATFPICRPARLIAVRDGGSGFDSNYLETYARGEEISAVSDTPPYAPIENWDGRSDIRAVEIPMPADKTPVTTFHVPAGNYQFIAVRPRPEVKPVTISQRQPNAVLRFDQCS